MLGRLRGRARGPKGPRSRRPGVAVTPRRDAEHGFTLVELLITVTILPMVVGALAVGLMSVFSLQSGVSSRLSHTGDAQVVTANYQKDVQGASQITTASSSSPECGPGVGTQLLGLQYALDTSGDANSGSYLVRVSYVSVPVVGATSTTYSLERLYCTNYSQTPSSTSVLAYDLASSEAPPTLTCVQSVNSSVCAGASTQWISTENVRQVNLLVRDAQGNFPYQLIASPLAATSTSTAGSPVSASTGTGCSFASPGSGTYAQNLCFIDFTSLSGAALAQAQGGGCLEMSVGLPNNYTLYFCISLSGGLVLPWYLPTWTNGFLGNSINGIPFYTGVSGFPALYQRQSGTTSTVKFTNLSVVSPSGVPATGWQFVSVDAESSDDGESITWTANAPITVIPNGEAGQVQPVGNACGNGLSGSGTTTVTCLGKTTYDALGNKTIKTGTAMVEAITPTQMTTKLVGTGLEGVAFGLMLP